MPLILWIIIVEALMCILFKMSSVIIYHRNQVLSWIDFSCVLNVDLRSLIRSAPAIFHFCFWLWKFLSIILKSMVLTFLCDFSMVCFKTCDMWSLPLWSFTLSLLFNEHFLPHNCQCKLAQDILYDKLNHGYVQTQFCFWHWNSCSV